jgi:lipopolysaccharide transport system ATP-binding protein
MTTARQPMGTISLYDTNTIGYIVVQATAGLEVFSRLVRNHPQLLRDYHLVVLPISPILGDDASFGDDLPGSVCLPTWPAPLLLAELIGQAVAVVGISLHLAITALAFGVPVFRLAETFDGKYAVLSDFDTVAPFESEIDPRWFAARLGRAEPSPAVCAALSRLSEHWDNIASVFAAGDGTPATLQALGRFWQLINWLRVLHILLTSCSI